MPDHSTFSVNRHGRFRDSDIFRQLFEAVVKTCMSVGFGRLSVQVLHHHGRHEVAVYVVRGRSEIRWGEQLEFAAEIGPGDFVYFAPYVPHQERNLDDQEALQFVVVRSDNERIAVGLDVEAAARPEFVF